MRVRRRSSGSSSRVRFLGSDRGNAHLAWYKTIADHYDNLYNPQRTARAYPFLQDLFRRHGPTRDILDVACGTFSLDLPLLRYGYRVTGIDRSSDMLRVARRAVAKAEQKAELRHEDLRSLNLRRSFDAILCLGTAFNYLTEAADARRAMTVFRRHLRTGGLLVLDLTNFDAWIRNPQNARAEVDYRAPDGTRIAIFAFNDQERARGIHHARFLTAIQKGRRIDIAFDEAPLRIWRKEGVDRLLRRSGFRPVEWWGDLRLGVRYVRRKSPRLVSVAARL